MKMQSVEFQELVRQKGAELYRDMPWRRDVRPYYVLVSELMLQQTQVDRVRPKFEKFIAAFPDEERLSRASLADVLRLWQGLGYNRRAKYLQEAAKQIINVQQGMFPDTIQGLVQLPGVGKNTAGAICAYAFNKPIVFVETNIRTVYYHHFFANQSAVLEQDLLRKIQETLDGRHPREFYWALMDYGAWLKRRGIATNAKNSHYHKQSPLKGSVREMRGQIIRTLSSEPLTDVQLRRCISVSTIDSRYPKALAGLVQDGLIEENEGIYSLTK